METIVRPNPDTWFDLCKRPGFNPEDLERNVSALLRQVKTYGKSAISELTEKFDGYNPDPIQLSLEEIRESEGLVSSELKQAIKNAAANIKKFHRTQIRQCEKVEIAPGIQCWQKDVPIESVGLYIPGGTAPLFSTVLMLGIPSGIAGCKEISLCTPAGKDGKIHPAILYAASICGITKVFRIGGVQAIGAMAYGISPVPKADKIFGPGNQYVTMAKQLVSRQGIAIDMPAGPSEVLVMADETADPAFVAADLISQAEHGSDSQVMLLCQSESFVNSVTDELDIILANLPRATMAKESLENSRAVVLDSIEEMLTFSNIYAPEHLIISVEKASAATEGVSNAGSVFVGHYSPESAGDYASGTNHTLPTNGYARAYSGLTTQSFMKTIQYQELTKLGLENLGSDVVTMAKEEGLDGHALAVLVRLTKSGMKKFDAFSWARQNIRDLVPYSSARDEFTGENYTFLDANESPFETGLNRYPDPYQKELKKSISQLKGCSPGQLFLGNGSDEAIDLLFRCFTDPGKDRVLSISPSYGMYKVCADINGVGFDTVLLEEDFSINPDVILNLVEPETKIIFLCSPNNPSGNTLDGDAVIKVLENFNGLVVVDEAYQDFSEKEGFLSLIGDYQNLVVLQTFSKAWGLAGVRLGMAMADATIISYMSKVKYPYNINTLSQKAILDALDRKETVDENIRIIKEQREEVVEALKKIPVIEKLYPSDANFVLIRIKNARWVYERLLERGVVVRDRSTMPLCEDCLRITIGTLEENREMLRALAGLL